MCCRLSRALDVAPSSAPPAWRTAYLRTEGGRLLVRWCVARESDFLEMKADFRRTFPRHCDAIWRRKERCWSLPLSQRQRLEEWLSGWRLEVQGEERAAEP